MRTGPDSPTPFIVELIWDLIRIQRESMLIRVLVNIRGRGQVHDVSFRLAYILSGVPDSDGDIDHPAVFFR